MSNAELLFTHPRCYCWATVPRLNTAKYVICLATAAVVQIVSRVRPCQQCKCITAIGLDPNPNSVIWC